jgi:hypothetical protein
LKPKVTNIPPNPHHELAPHFEPEPLTSITWREALWIAGAPLVALAIVLGLAWLHK